MRIDREDSLRRFPARVFRGLCGRAIWTLRMLHEHARILSSGRMACRSVLGSSDNLIRKQVLRGTADAIFGVMAHSSFAGN